MSCGRRQAIIPIFVVPTPPQPGRHLFLLALPIKLSRLKITMPSKLFGFLKRGGREDQQAPETSGPPCGVFEVYTPQAECIAEYVSCALSRCCAGAELGIPLAASSLSMGSPAIASTRGGARTRARHGSRPSFPRRCRTCGS